MVAVVAAGAVLWAIFRPAPHPGFTVDRLVHGYNGALEEAAWEIINTDPSPLVIMGVIYNGEFAACPSRTDADFPDAGVTFPFSLSIGDAARFLEYSRSRPGHPGFYQKQVIFIDVATNRGTFRFRPGQGFTSESASVDLLLVQRSDAAVKAFLEESRRQSDEELARVKKENEEAAAKYNAQRGDSIPHSIDGNRR